MTTIRIDLSASDLTEARRQLAKGMRGTKRYWVNFLTCGTSAAFFLHGVLHLRDIKDRYPECYAFVHSQLLWMYAGLMIFALRVMWLSQRGKTAESKSLRPYHLTVDELGISLQWPDELHRYLWTSIGHIQLTKSLALIVRLNRGDAIVVPRRCLPDDAAFNVFVHEIETIARVPVFAA
jgi:hypothetical protein